MMAKKVWLRSLIAPGSKSDYLIYRRRTGHRNQNHSTYRRRGAIQLSTLTRDLPGRSIIQMSKTREPSLGDEDAQSAAEPPARL